MVECPSFFFDNIQGSNLDILEVSYPLSAILQAGQVVRKEIVYYRKTRNWEMQMKQYKIMSLKAFLQIQATERSPCPESVSDKAMGGG